MTDGIIAFGIGAVAAGLIIWFILRARINDLSQKMYSLHNELSRTHQRSENAEQTNVDIRKERDTLRERMESALGNISRLEAEKLHLSETLQTQQSNLEQIRRTFSAEFQNLASTILEEKSKRFTEQNARQMHLLLQPLHDNIKAFQHRVEETYDKESKQRFSLEKEIKRLYQLNEQITQEARNPNPRRENRKIPSRQVS